MADMNQDQDRIAALEGKIEELKQLLEAKAAKLKPAADQHPSVYKTTIQNAKPTAVLEHLLHDAGPWSLECDSHDIRLVDKYIDKKAVKTPELSPDIWSEVKKNNSLRAKASGIHNSIWRWERFFVL